MPTRLNKTILLILATLLVVSFIVLTRLVWGWTNPTANPPGGSASFFFDGTNFGFGTALPAAKLDVFSSASDNILKISRGATTSTLFRVGADSGFVIQNQATDALIIKSGNVGIGITPTSKLHVSGNLNVTGAATFGSTVDVSTNKITNLAAPTASADAATKAYVDAAGAPPAPACKPKAQVFTTPGGATWVRPTSTINLVWVSMAGGGGPGGYANGTGGGGGGGGAGQVYLRYPVVVSADVPLAVGVGGTIGSGGGPSFFGSVTAVAGYGGGTNQGFGGGFGGTSGGGPGGSIVLSSVFGGYNSNLTGLPGSSGTGVNSGGAVQGLVTGLPLTLVAVVAVVERRGALVVLVEHIRMVARVEVGVELALAVVATAVTTRWVAAPAPAAL